MIISRNLFARALIAAVLAVGGGSIASGESISVHGVYAANANIPADIQIILIDRFRGDLGQDAEIALAELLGGVFIRGEPYFDLVTPGALRTAVVEVKGQDGTIITRPLSPDAELRGTVRSEEIERNVEPKVERECVRRDQDGDCTERREVRIECRELTVRVEPRILLSAADGRQLYSHSATRSQSARYCADDNSIPSSLGIITEIIDAMAAEIRNDLAPRESTRNIRVMERRRVLRREDRDAFRAAVDLTGSDMVRACEAFMALEAANPNHVSVLFNIGLCLEWDDDLTGAEQYYNRALEQDPGRDYPSDGLNRIRSRKRAEAQLTLRDQY